MTRLSDFLTGFAGDRRGATAIEYGLIGALICTVIIGALVALGGGVEDSWDATSDELTAVNGGGDE